MVKAHIYCSFGLTICLVAQSLGLSASAQTIINYRGVCDASTAVMVGPEHFVVAEDEKNALWIYRVGQSDGSKVLELRDYLGGKESDLEGSARIGDTVFWIGSHGRNKDGEKKPLRHRFFATQLTVGATSAIHLPAQPPVTDLIEQMAANSQYFSFDLKTAASVAPESDSGLNIEGMAATPDKQLLIGFRNPRPGGFAIIALLQNPFEVIEGKPAKFGPPLRLDLKGNGIRSMEWVNRQLFIIAGPHNDGKGDGSDFNLYSLKTIDSTPQAVEGVSLNGLNAEALFENSEGNLHVLSDDGDVLVGGKKCKDVDASKRSFRGMTVVLLSK